MNDVEIRDVAHAIAVEFASNERIEECAREIVALVRDASPAAAPDAQVAALREGDFAARVAKQFYECTAAKSIHRWESLAPEFQKASIAMMERAISAALSPSPSTEPGGKK